MKSQSRPLTRSNDQLKRIVPILQNKIKIIIAAYIHYSPYYYSLLTFIKTAVHDIDEADAKRGEHVEQFDNEMSARTHQHERRQALAQVQLLRQYLLNILLAFHWKSLKSKSFIRILNFLVINCFCKIMM